MWQLAVLLRRVPSGERADFINQLEAVFSERSKNYLKKMADVLLRVPEGRLVWFLRQLQNLLGDRRDLKKMDELGALLFELEFGGRGGFIEQLRELVRGFVGSAMELCELVKLLCRVPEEERKDFIRQLAKLVTSFESLPLWRSITPVAEVLFQFPFEKRDEFTRQLYGFSRNRLGMKMSPYAAASMLSQVPEQNRVNFIKQLQALVANRAADDRELTSFAKALSEVEEREMVHFMRQLEELVRDRRDNLYTLRALLESLCKIPMGERRDFMRQLQSVAIGREGSVEVVFQFVRRFSRVHFGAREMLIKQVQGLIAGRLGGLWEVCEIMTRLQGQRREFIQQLQELIKDREMDLGGIAALAYALDNIRPEQRMQAIQTLRPEMTVFEAADALIQFAPLEALNHVHVHQVAQREMRAIYCSIRERYSGELVSQEEAMRLLRGWIDSHPLLDSERQDDNRALMRELLAHSRWSSTMEMGFRSLVDNGRVSGSELLRLVVTYIRNMPEGPNRDAEISRLLEQGLLDAITAFHDRSTIEGISCSQGIAERLLLAFRGPPKLNANDLAAKFQRVEAIRNLMNLGHEPISTKIAESLMGIPKNGLRNALNLKLQELLAEQKQNLLAEGYQEAIILTAMRMLREQFNIAEEDIERVWSRLHP